MDNYTKRFLREFILSGLYLGSFWGIYVSFDSGWKTGIINGIGMGLFSGLFVAYFNAKEFSRPIYPLRVRPPANSSGIIKSEFQLQGFLFIKDFVLAGLMFVLLIWVLSEPTELSNVFHILFLGISIIAVSIWNGIRVVFTKLVINSNGIELVSVLYKLRVTWDEVEQIERRGKNWYIICRSSTLITIPILDKWLRFVEADRIISLRGYSSDFLESELAISILHYAKNISFTSV